MIANFLNNFFEEIISVGLVLWGGLAFLVLLVRVQGTRRDLARKKLAGFLKEIFFYGFLSVQTFLVIVLIYGGWCNMQEKAALDPSMEIDTNTRWVKDKPTIYFISDNKLVSIRMDGSDRQTVFEATEPIREYHFSPDGRHMLIVTTARLLRFDRQNKNTAEIDALPSSADASAGYQGVIDGVRWAPDSLKFCYRTAKWTPFSSVDQWYVFDLQAEKKKPLQHIALTIHKLDWDAGSENLYFSWFNALDPTQHLTPYLAKVYRIPVKTLVPETAVEFPSYDETVLSPETLERYHIRLDPQAGQYAFGRLPEKDIFWDDEEDTQLGIDETDHLYYVRHRWWRKRLYRIPRVPVEGDLARYDYKGGRLAVQHLRWLPSRRYVIMEHYLFGILIMEPWSGKVGILDNQRGHTFGWAPRQKARTL